MENREMGPYGGELVKACQVDRGFETQKLDGQTGQWKKTTAKTMK